MASLSTSGFVRVSASGGRRRTQVAVRAQTRVQIKVCTNQHCKNQGAAHILQFFRDLGLEELDIRERPCMGDCGYGPNLQIAPQDGSMGERFNHVNSPTKAAQALEQYCGITADPAVVQTTELRLAGNLAARQGNLKKAVQLFTQGLEQPTEAGRHLLLSNRSSVRLSLGDADGALQDAQAAAECAPPGFTTACLRQADALLRLGRAAEVPAVLAAAAERCTGFEASEDYQAYSKQAQRAAGSPVAAG